MWARIQGEVSKEGDLEPVLQLVLESQARIVPVQLQCSHWRKHSISGELKAPRLFLDPKKSSLKFPLLGYWMLTLKCCNIGALRIAI